ncbi:MAG: SMC family ATPase, partial [Dehalococcoidia bacterium]|nr:SMC family ATPase [Dehalococcoidia bacterium]
EARIQVEKLEAEIGELGYDASRHDAVRESIMDLVGFAKLRQQLDSALGQIEWDRVQLEQTGTDLHKLRSELSEMQERRDLLSVEAARLPEAQSELRRCRVNFDELEKRLTGARVRLGIAQEAVERCKRMAREAAELGRKRDDLIRERGLYEELSIAFGRNGIQALIIEDALPQIENDSNDLLGRLTDNRMSLKLQLVDGRRIRGSDALTEEMSIDISDEMGTRAYETFSGGEAFRINFALRIALSRLLARRSGAPLPILFIDEGFGSQDAAGQERLIEAIQSIRDDFDKIVVITHVEGIKEAFDTRIQVQKTDMGSTFEIVWA